MPPDSWKPVKREKANPFLKGVPSLDRMKQNWVPCEGECRGKGYVMDERESPYGYTIRERKNCLDCGGSGGHFEPFENIGSPA